MKKDEHKHLGLSLDSKLDFISHIRQAILKAKRGIGMIKYLSKYVSRDVLDQIYKLYVRPHLDYGDIIYHRHDPEMLQHFTIRLEQPSTQQHLLFQELGEEQIGKGSTRNWVGKVYIIEDGSDD